MATFQGLRDYITLNVRQNLNYLHIVKVLNDMLDLLAVATNTYSGGDNIQITSDGVINLVADEYTKQNLESGFAEGCASATENE